jgi:hypothetical protein
LILVIFDGYPADLPKIFRKNPRTSANLKMGIPTRVDETGRRLRYGLF